MSERPRLRADALDHGTVAVIGVASAAPAYSLAAALGLITASCGVGLPAMLLLAFIPMACIASAFDQFNRIDPDCGASFAWVTRAFGPTCGWLTGWAVIAADIVVMGSLAQIAAQYSLALLGVAHGEHPQLTLALGVVWIAAMTWVCCRGITFSARLQTFLLLLELGVLLALAVLILHGIYGTPRLGSVRPTLGWFWPRELRFHALMDAMGVAIFIYWGWDTALNVNAESRDPHRTPGRAAILATVLLLAIFVLAGTTALGWAGPQFLVAHQDDVLAALGAAVFGHPWDKLLHIVVLTSAVASTQTTILPTARTVLSMAEKGALPQYFTAIEPQHAVPLRATVWMGVASTVWYVALAQTTTAVVAGSLAALNFLVAFYFGLTGVACAWHFRKTFSGFSGFFRQVAAPLTGGLALFGLMAYLTVAAANDGTDGWPVALALALMTLGWILMDAQRRRAGGGVFWTGARESI